MGHFMELAVHAPPAKIFNNRCPFFRVLFSMARPEGMQGAVFMLAPRHLCKIISTAIKAPVPDRPPAVQVDNSRPGFSVDKDFQYAVSCCFDTEIKSIILNNVYLALLGLLIANISLSLFASCCE